MHPFEAGNPFATFPATLAKLVGHDAAEDAGRAELDALMKTCRHPAYRLRVTVAVNGQRMYFCHCPNCGERTVYIPRANLTRQQQHDAAEWRGREGEPPTAADRIRSRWMASRDAGREIRWTPGFRGMYMASPEWAARRIEVMKRANNWCESCRIKPAEEVHHLTYRRLGNEPMDHLQAVCRDCHEAIHSRPEVMAENSAT